MWESEERVQGRAEEERKRDGEKERRGRGLLLNDPIAKIYTKRWNGDNELLPQGTDSDRTTSTFDRYVRASSSKSMEGFPIS